MTRSWSDGPASRRPAGPGLGRRAFLAGLGGAAGLALARGLGAGGWGDRNVSRLSSDEVLRRLVASLTAGQRQAIVLPADHPSRQITNTVAFLQRPHLGTVLGPDQRLLVRRLYETMLSPRGREDFAATVAVEGPLDGCVLAVYGDPEREPAQALLCGGHLTLRTGGSGSGGAALGGALAYGQQVGNFRWRVEGNAFAYHGDAANRLFSSLSARERRRAILPEPPHELVLQVQAHDGVFPGVPVSILGEPARDELARLLEAVLAPFPEAGRREALSHIDANGGLDELRVAFYASRGFYPDMQAWSELPAAERARRGDPYWQVWRIEGPGTVIHFKGYPHVHAYLQIVRDPLRAGLGEALAEVPARIEGESMRRLLEAALRHATGERLAWHAPEVPGRFCPGVVTTGLAWTLDPFGNRVVVAEIDGRAMAAPLRTRLAAAGVHVSSERRYRIATTDYFAGRAQEFGEPAALEPRSLELREALVSALRERGLDLA